MNSRSWEVRTWCERTQEEPPGWVPLVPCHVLKRLWFHPQGKILQYFTRVGFEIISGLLINVFHTLSTAPATEKILDMLIMQLPRGITVSWTPEHDLTRINMWHGYQDRPTCYWFKRALRSVPHANRGMDIGYSEDISKSTLQCCNDHIASDRKFM